MDLRELKILGIFLSNEVNSLNDSGSREWIWSGPSNDLSKVKCFSITFAPRTAAANGVVISKLWSEYPTIWVNSFKEVIVPNALSFIERG